MDVNMPIMNGIECTKCIRRFELENSIKFSVIFISSAYYGGDDSLAF